MVDGGGGRPCRIAYAIHRWDVNWSVMAHGVGQAEGVLMFFQGAWEIKHARAGLGCIIGRQVLTNTNDWRRT